MVGWKLLVLRDVDLALTHHGGVRRDLPSGTVTFLFTDVEGSTKLLKELGADDYAEAPAEHRGILRVAFGGQGGVEVDTQGDAFFVAFPTASGAFPPPWRWRDSPRVPFGCGWEFILAPRT